MDEEKFTTRAKINLNEGLFEFVGTEEFVQKNLDLFKERVFQQGKNVETKTLERPTKFLPAQVKQNKQNENVLQKRTPLPSIIQFDVGKNENKPSLEEFFQEKGNPQVHFDIISCIAYYIKKYTDLKEFEEGHALYAYKHLRKKLP